MYLKVSKTGADGNTLKEAMMINSSLSALGLVSDKLWVVTRNILIHM